MVAHGLKNYRPFVGPAFVLAGRRLRAAVPFPVAAFQASNTAWKAPFLVEGQDASAFLVLRRARVGRLVIVDDELDEALHGDIGDRLQQPDVLVETVRHVAVSKLAQRGDDLLERMRLGTSGCADALAEKRLVLYVVVDAHEDSA